MNNETGQFVDKIVSLIKNSTCFEDIQVILSDIESSYIEFKSVIIAFIFSILQDIKIYAFIALFIEIIY